MSRSRLKYWRRLAGSYLGRGQSQLSFWWERPAAHPGMVLDRMGPYYMTFRDKAGYAGPFDPAGVPQLDYHGGIGRQYNPIAVSQYGLAKYNRFLETGAPEERAAFLLQADWLAANLQPNAHGLKVWMHYFDWEYADGLKAPWYSGLAQGQGISCLVRAHAETKDLRYLRLADQAFQGLAAPVAEGGTVLEEPGGDVWIEEYVTRPPSHILNGFIWALWGVHDYAIATGREDAAGLFDAGSRTVERNLARFDTGWWSTYDLLPQRLRCLASPFYHALHVVQLRVMARLTGRSTFALYADRWEGYAKSRARRTRALAQKAAFKVLYY